MVLIDSKHKLIERLRVDTGKLDQLPFFRELDRMVCAVLDAQRGVHGNMSYIIWGGVAANIVLCLLGRCRVHYSFHDVELLVTRDGNIHHSADLVQAMQIALSSKQGLCLDVGGLAISISKHGIPIEEFQSQRAMLCDGDLLLNNIVLIVNREECTVVAEAPVGTVTGLIGGGITLAMRDASELRSADRISRRIYRTISKVMRFEEAAGLFLSDSSLKLLTSLIATFEMELQLHFVAREKTNQEWIARQTWLETRRIDSVERGEQWMIERVISEAAMRLAGLHRVDPLDKLNFAAFVLGLHFGKCGIFGHPLVQLIGSTLGQSSWLNNRDVREQVTDQCYDDFRRYQRPEAGRLYYSYSPSFVL